MSVDADSERMTRTRVRIRLYRPADRRTLEGFFDAFQDELVTMDDLHRLLRAPGYGAAAVEQCLREARQERGRVLIAEVDRRPVGFAAAVIRSPGPDAHLSARIGLYGKVTELYVHPSARRRGIATRLLARLDRHFIRAGCDTVRIEVFAPNVGARFLYERLGYRERDIELIRPMPRDACGREP